MVLKSIQRIKVALPEVKHVVMFYNNGTIFQTTFEQSINIPKLGEHLAELLEHAHKVYEISLFKVEKYKKLIFETEDMSLIILKLGEDSNLALFFEREEDKQLKISAIKRYLNRIEELIDTDIIELDFHELTTKENELKNLEVHLKSKQEGINALQEKLKIEKDILLESETVKITKNIKELNDDYEKIKKDMTLKETEIIELKKKIEDLRKK